MPLKTQAANVTALLLVGGFGTRLRSRVPSSPKPLATVGESSFLDILVRQLQAQGVRRLVMCTGYLGDQIENRFKDGSAFGVSIRYSMEMSPMGTAGAVKLAHPHLDSSDHFLVMNGDSFMDFDLDEMISFHHQHGGLATMTIVEVEDAGRYGTVQVDEEGRVNGFAEKTGLNAPGLVNAGVYLFSPEVLRYIPEGPASLEREVFPQLIDRGLFALRQSGLFIDIGTPEDYDRAQAMCDKLVSAARQNEERIEN
jgi:NDP-sugar pyrophosphorylase family protein